MKLAWSIFTLLMVSNKKNLLYGRNDRKCTVYHLRSRKIQLACSFAVLPDSSHSNLGLQNIFIWSEKSITKHMPIQIYWTLYHQKKNVKFQIKDSDKFHISAKIIDCGYPLEPPRRGDSNAYQQSMSLGRNKKNNVYSCKPQFYFKNSGV